MNLGIGAYEVGARVCLGGCGGSISILQWSQAAGASGVEHRSVWTPQAPRGKVKRGCAPLRRGDSENSVVRLVLENKTCIIALGVLACF